jgi:hypothetical protein
MTAWLGVALAMLITRPPPRTCGSPAVARERLAQVRQRFQPGMTFNEVCDKIQPPALVKEYWGSPPRGEMGPWILSGRDGSRAATEAIDCDFDSADRLVSCKNVLDLTEIQEIRLGAYEGLSTGQAVADVVAQLCQPGVRSDKDGTTVFEYWVLRPLAKFNKTCPVYLSFRDGRLVDKQMVCR